MKEYKHTREEIAFMLTLFNKFKEQDRAYLAKVATDLVTNKAIKHLDEQFIAGFITAYRYATFSADFQDPIKIIPQ
jgi:hypothetical protein